MGYVVNLMRIPDNSITRIARRRTIEESNPNVKSQSAAATNFPLPLAGRRLDCTYLLGYGDD